VTDLDPETAIKMLEFHENLEKTALFMAVFLLIYKNFSVF